MKGIYIEDGELNGIIRDEAYANGRMKECTLQCRNEVETPYGILVPQYEQEEARRKYTKSLSFYESGSLKSMQLQEQTRIATAAGDLDAELITFYENGSIKRLFPLNGRISGYWTEEDEYGRAKEYEFSLKSGTITARIISVYFYENGEIKSLTFWPQSPVEIASPIGIMEVRSGISFYPGGKIKSLEPKRPVGVHTPIGRINAYSTSVLGIHGDSNSLSFYESGEIKTVTTSTDIIRVVGAEGGKRLFYPVLAPSLLVQDKMEVRPLQLEFIKGRVRMNNCPEDEFSIEESSFFIRQSPGLLKEGCGSCSACSACM